MTSVGILLCAGSAARMGFEKLTAPLGGQTAIVRAAEALIAGGVDKLVVTTGPATRAYIEGLAFAVPHTLAEGGETRTDSVRRALAAAEGDIALIHDAARCFVTPQLVRQCLHSAIRFGSGVAAIKATDTALMEAGELPPLPEGKNQLLHREKSFRTWRMMTTFARPAFPSRNFVPAAYACGHVRAPCPGQAAAGGFRSSGARACRRTSHGVRLFRSRKRVSDEAL